MRIGEIDRIGDREVPGWTPRRQSEPTPQSEPSREAPAPAPAPQRAPERVPG